MPLISLLLVLATKDCKRDPECFRAAIATCGPSTYSTSEKQELDMRPPIAMKKLTSYRVVPGGGEECRLDVDLTITEVQSRALSASQAHELADASTASPLASLVCVGTPAQIAGHVFSNEPGLACYPLGCPPPTAAVAPGCAWSQCERGLPRLECTSKGSTRTCELGVSRFDCTSKGCRYLDGSACTYRGRKASCGLPVLLSGTATCTASCARDGEAATIACR